MSLVAYVEVKYNDADNWTYCGEYIRNRSGSFEIAPRIYYVDDMTVCDFSRYMRVHSNYALIHVSDEVNRSAEEYEFDTCPNSVCAFSFDALATVHAIANEQKNVRFDSEEFEYIVSDLFNLIMDRICFKYENEYRVVVFDAPEL